MVLRETIWRPDTCDCEIIYEWDDREPEDRRVHRLKRVISRCSVHSGIPLSSLFDVVLEENRRKNMTLDFAQSIVHTVGLENYRWSFDSNRTLIVEISGLTASQKKGLQSSCDTSFGAGKVIVK